jgi:hypothetical protein
MQVMSSGGTNYYNYKAWCLIWQTDNLSFKPYYDGQNKEKVDSIEQPEVLGRNNSLISFDMTRTTQKTKLPIILILLRPA